MRSADAGCASMSDVDKASGLREVVVVPGVVTVPPAPGRRHVASLSDLDLAVLGG